ISAASNIQSYIAPLNLIFCGNVRPAYMEWKERGLRILNLEIGAMLQQTMLQAAIHGLGTHIYMCLPFENVRDWLLQLTDPYNLPLAGMLIGHPRKAEEGLFETLWY